jgi:hypothetical protein
MIELGNDAMTADSIRNYREFWTFYVGEHRKPLTRRLHFAGTTGAILSIAAALFLANFWWLVAAPVIAYGLAWSGHFWVERNRPATFKYPLWSLAADFRMYGLMLAGRMDAEVRRLDG